MLYSCTHVAPLGVKGLIWAALYLSFFSLHFFILVIHKLIVVKIGTQITRRHFYLLTSYRWVLQIDIISKDPENVSKTVEIVGKTLLIVVMEYSR